MKTREEIKSLFNDLPLVVQRNLLGELLLEQELQGKVLQEAQEDFLKNGFTKNEALISIDEVLKIRGMYDILLNDKKRTSGFRSDLSGGNNNKTVEKITQIMRPSLLESKLLNNEVYQLASNWVKSVLGEDMELDFDMFINKAPNTNTPTPWHQDAAYWIKMPDKRSVSCWIALDNVWEENGCMWFIPKEKNQNLLKHSSPPNGGALYCKTDTYMAQSIPLNAGGCTFHDGFTLHFSKGNATESQRRALILNFRPTKMIALERSLGVNHTGKRKIRNS